MAFNPSKLVRLGVSPRNKATPSRRVEPAFEAPIEEFSQRIGRVLWAWNYCHSAFARLFAILVNPQHMEIGIALWHPIRNDSTQRELLLAVARATLQTRKPILRRIEWAVKSADRLGMIRNDAAHMATGFRVSTPIPEIVIDTISTLPARTERLKGANLDKLFSQLRGDLIALAHYMNALTAEISVPGHYTLPRRPLLQSIPKPQRARKQGHHGRRTKPSDRQPPSQA